MVPLYGLFRSWSASIARVRLPQCGSDGIRWGRVAESEGVTGQCFESGVDRRGGSVRGAVVDAGEPVGSASVQGASEWGEVVETVRN